MTHVDMDEALRKNTAEIALDNWHIERRAIEGHKKTMPKKKIAHCSFGEVAPFHKDVELSSVPRTKDADVAITGARFDIDIERVLKEREEAPALAHRKLREKNEEILGLERSVATVELQVEKCLAQAAKAGKLVFCPEHVPIVNTVFPEAMLAFKRHTVEKHERLAYDCAVHAKNSEKKFYKP